jgi:hypothetical protein
MDFSDWLRCSDGGVWLTYDDFVRVHGLHEGRVNWDLSETRIARDGCFYTRREFNAYYGFESDFMWAEADDVTNMWFVDVFYPGSPDLSPRVSETGSVVMESFQIACVLMDGSILSFSSDGISTVGVLRARVALSLGVSIGPINFHRQGRVLLNDLLSLTDVFEQHTALPMKIDRSNRDTQTKSNSSTQHTHSRDTIRRK